MKVMLKIFRKKSDLIPLIDVVVGKNQNTSKMVIHRGRDRGFNNLMVGSIGSGMIAALVLPVINQDLHHMTFMINNYEKYFTLGNIHTSEIKGKFLNGLSIIEPTKHLCDSTLKLVKAHGIPKEVVFYIDPTNPNTPSLNLFKGPTDKVAETFVEAIINFVDPQDSFLEYSQRSHLKHHIYLLKEHDPDTEVGFEELINMYNDPQLVGSMLLKLKERLGSIGQLDTIEDREQRNYLYILKGISDWFDKTYVPVNIVEGEKNKQDIIFEGPYRGKQRIVDTSSKFVEDLRNTLNDIASNNLMRRVLFGKSDFDFDKHLEQGGILLVNTAKGELGRLSSILGRLCTSSLQNAVFRRDPTKSIHHHILINGIPDNICENFNELLTQSIKYKTVITVITDSALPLQQKYGPDFITTLYAALRNKFFLGDLTTFDKEMFGSIFGEFISFVDDKIKIKQSNAYVTTDIFVSVVKLVEDCRTTPAQLVKAIFVPKEEFIEAKIKVNDEAAKKWLEYHNN